MQRLTRNIKKNVTMENDIRKKIYKTRSCSVVGNTLIFLFNFTFTVLKGNGLK